ncbi:hypothetical protein EJ066_18555 [Mesorhizobium sp. M9A.F.Ca.ET.002.03.1.2]|uniref:hypothetical protein n=1 Tax=Mesorhizobium sp. M9A.F.Ca.ET.002.03.1.2 TaxID=2493668 RepID=UPI000F764884|nr:hypothetical protein [Mesorhizobium sp. M9A.F.Ca.ET.002.03.1.2]AZN98976.1 hypothetical protein EJ066_18555 [Mesorhizobium sp. M9A.F.Ca.ET.002.03.1.2]
MRAQCQTGVSDRIGGDDATREDHEKDGTLTSDDITSRQRKVFAMLDRNNDGRIEKSELPKKGRGFGHRWGGDDSMQ